MEKQWVCAVVVAIFLAGMCNLSYAQEGFGTNQPNKASVIDLTSTSKGLLIPRVELIDLATFAPIQGVIPGQEHTANSLLVYNTTTVVAGNITPGYYYWNKPDAVTAGKWVRLSTGGPSILSQDLQAGTLTFDDGTDNTETYDIHWKLDENETGLSTNNNEASGNYSVAMGGGVNVNGTPVPNSVTGSHAAVISGYANSATGPASVITGGGQNRTEDQFSSVSGGNNNQATATNATVGGGFGNTASGGHSVISGGDGNLASAAHSTVSGGSQNEAIGEQAVISGGSINRATGKASTVSGGMNNEAASFGEWVGGLYSTRYITGYTPSATDWVGTDRLFNIGNGTASAKRDAFTILKNGRTGIGFSNFESVAVGARDQQLQVNGNVRISGLPSNVGNTVTDKIVLADNDGILKTVAASSLAAPDYTRVFYMPSIVFDTSSPGTGFTRNLYNEYVAQFTGKKVESNGSVSDDPSEKFISSTDAPAEIPHLPNATDLYYYITDYDTTALGNLSIDPNGVLTYDVIGIGTDYSLVNIVFVVK